MLPTFRMQFRAITSRKMYLVTLLFIFVLVFLNHSINIYTYRGYDRTQMYDPMRLLLVSYHGRFNMVFTTLLPLLATLPAGFAVFHDRNTRALTFLASRKGRSAYYLATGIAVFTTTLLVFAVPLLVEIVLSFISFPPGAAGDPFSLGHGIYLSGLSTSFTSFLFYPIYYHGSAVYAAFFILYVSTLCGLLALITNAVACFKIGYRVILFLPSYLLLYLTSNLGFFSQAGVSQPYLLFVTAFDNGVKDPIPFFVSIGLASVLAIGVFVFKSRKDALI